MYKDKIIGGTFMKLEKMKFSILLCLFAITLFVSSLFKPNLNYIDAQTLADNIVGVGEIKSTRIIKERDEHGFFLGEKDFANRVKDLGIGEVVLNRITKKYRLDN